MVRWVAGVCACLFLAVLLPLPFPVAAQGPSVSVLVDFADGTYLWADVRLPATNVTALKATEIANATWALPPIEVDWFDSPFCLRTPCAFVNDIGDRNPAYPLWWHFYVWNITARAWDLAAVGPSDIDLAEGDAIGWYLAVDDPETFAAPRPVATPDFRDVYTSFRGDLMNRGIARGTVPVTNPLLWERDLGVLEIDTTPVVAYGLVFVATRNALVALDAETGTQVWRNGQVRSLLSTPAVYNGHLVLGGTDGKLHYVDALTGQEAWSVVLEAAVRSTGIASSPAVHESRAYVGTFNETVGGKGRVVAVNLNNGTIAWAYDAPGVIHMSQPAISGGKLYVGVMGAYDGDIGYGPPHGLLSLRADGTLNWFFETEGSVASSPVVAPSLVFVTAKDGYVYAVNLDGTLAWRNRVGASTSSPSLVGNTLYVASGGLDGQGEISAFSLEGIRRWEASPGGAVQASLVSDGHLVCGATNVASGQYICLVEGHLAWNYTPSPRQYILGSPVVAGDTLYAPSDNGRVYAFRDGNPSANPLLGVAIRGPSALREGSTVSVSFVTEGVGRGRAVDVLLRVTISAGFRLTGETVDEARAARSVTLDVGEVPPNGNETREFVGTVLAGFTSFGFAATLSYRDLAGRSYPDVEQGLTIGLEAVSAPLAWVAIAIPVAVVAGVLAFYVWRKRRRGDAGGA